MLKIVGIENFLKVKVVLERTAKVTVPRQSLNRIGVKYVFSALKGLPIKYSLPSGYLTTVEISDL